MIENLNHLNIWGRSSYYREHPEELQKLQTLAYADYLHKSIAEQEGIFEDWEAIKEVLGNPSYPETSTIIAFTAMQSTYRKLAMSTAGVNLLCNTKQLPSTCLNFLKKEYRKTCKNLKRK